MIKLDTAKDIQQVYGIPVVNAVDYWLVRTESGLYYDDFVENGFVGIGWDYLDENTIRTKSVKELIEIIEVKTQKKNDVKTRYGSVASKLKRFVTDIKKNDIIIIPSGSSAKIAIGQAIDDAIYTDDIKYKEKDNLPQEICPFIKRRKIKWIKEIEKDEIDIYLYKLLYAHHAIYSANEYAEYICRSIYPIYMNDNRIFVTFKAGKATGLSVDDFLKLADFVNLLFESGIDKTTSQVKINIHSPGLLEISALILSSGMALSAVIFALGHALNGGKIDYELRTKNNSLAVKSESKGLLAHRLDEEKFKSQQKLIEKYIELNHSIDLKVPPVDYKESADHEVEKK